MKRYYSFNDYCKEEFGEKVYRLSLDGGMTCPNRDGKLSTGGCIFCSAGGSGDFATPQTLSVSLQLENAKEKIKAKTNCKKYVAYFQSFSNTYAPVDYLEDLFSQAILNEEVVALSIATRCDCIPEDVLLLLARLNKIKPVWVELGLQTIHNSTHDILNTKTTVEQFDQAVARLTAHNIKVVAHIILGLPNESKEMMLETVNHVAHSPVWGVKLQLLHILKGTQLAQMYAKNPFFIFEMDDYIDFVIECVEHLNPRQVVHRLTGDGPKSLLIEPLWSSNKKRVLNTLTTRFQEKDAHQGQLFIP